MTQISVTKFCISVTFDFERSKYSNMDPVTLGLGAVSLGSQIFSAIKGGQANKANEELLRQQQEQNEAFYNNNQNFFDTNMAKSVLEKARERYQDNTKTSESKAEVTGASAEQQVAEKTANQKGYNDVVKNLASTGTRYTMDNERSYRNNLNRLMATKMQLNQQKADSASNAASNAGELFGSAAMLQGFGAESGIGKGSGSYAGISAENRAKLNNIAKNA